MTPPPDASPVPPRFARAGEVLDLLRRSPASSTSDLAAALGVARSTVAERLDILGRHGLVTSGTETSQGRGRPAARWAFNPSAGVTLTGQVGVSGVRVAVTDLAGEVLGSEQLEQDLAAGPDALCDLLQKGFAQALANAGRAGTRVFGIGIGLPGEVEFYGSPGDGGASWSASSFGERLSEVFGCPVFVDRDVNLMALGEREAYWPESRMFLCLKVGTVIACGLVVEGRIVRGAAGRTGEIGHVKVRDSDLPCTCGSTGCLNTVAGGAALAESLGRQGFEAHSARDLAALARSGVVEASQALRRAGRQTGEVVAAMVNLLNPDVITAWGYLVDAGDQFLAGMHEAIYRAALPSAARPLVLEPARLGERAGVRGAALAVIEHTLSPRHVDRLVSGSVPA